MLASLDWNGRCLMHVRLLACLPKCVVMQSNNKPNDLTCKSLPQLKTEGHLCTWPYRPANCSQTWTHSHTRWAWMDKNSIDCTGKIGLLTRSAHREPPDLSLHHPSAHKKALILTKIGNKSTHTHLQKTRREMLCNFFVCLYFAPDWARAREHV